MQQPVDGRRLVQRGQRLLVQPGQRRVRNLLNDASKNPGSQVGQLFFASLPAQTFCLVLLQRAAIIRPILGTKNLLYCTLTS